MRNLTIIPGIARSARSARTSSSAESGQKLTPELRQKIFERDGHSCQCCGFRSVKYQDVYFRNGIVSDPRPDNMATLCIFCHQCFHLDSVSEMRSGVLIWLPEIEQTDLHHIARAVYVARISQGPIADAARRSLEVLMHRREEARRRLGTDDPFILATVLRDYITQKSYESRKVKLEGLKLFPLDRRIIKESDLEFNQFPQILAYWRSKDGPFGGKVPKDWINLYKEIRRDAA
ncbi:MAG: type IV secretion protein DotN [Alphaproteobacteria bacterium CG_4_9_14_3_um_filter_47_13]|nr:MAG: type IV secretion protein DotN [Alphaproteobacteria bacterium CG_4_9_14_3_um_filter_47_13]